MHWTAADIGDLTGLRAVVTGANSGLGLATARELAEHGASVVLACRNQEKGAVALEGILAGAPDADVELARLDLADLASVRAFAETVDGPLGLLVNNAGLMAVPYARTVDGFEIQMGTNHLGHFALTALLLPALRTAPGARVVTLSSAMSYYGRAFVIDRGTYRGWGIRRWQAYADSKLANVTFALELDRRARSTGVDVLSAAAHPGWARTELQTKERGRVEDVFMTAVNLAVAQSADMGALPTLYAATSPEAAGGVFYGPDGLGAIRGYPRPVTPPRPARDQAARDWLWKESVRLTGIDPGL